MFKKLQKWSLYNRKFKDYVVNLSFFMCRRKFCVRFIVYFYVLFSRITLVTYNKFSYDSIIEVSHVNPKKYHGEPKSFQN